MIIWKKRMSLKLSLLCRKDGDGGEPGGEPDVSGGLDAFFDTFGDGPSGGSTKELVDQDVDQDVDEGDDQDVDEGDEPDDDYESDDDPDPGLVSTVDEPEELDEPQSKVLKAQEKLIDSLMAKVDALTAKLDGDEATSLPEPEIDPFESDEFKGMQDVMNWDADEASAFKTFFGKFMAHNGQKLMNEMLQKVPSTVGPQLAQQQKVQEAKDKFYSDNPELQTVKPYVAELAKTVSAELGEKADMQAVLDEVSKRAYSALGLKKKVGTKPGKKKPAFAGTKGARRQKQKVDPKQQEIDAVIGML